MSETAFDVESFHRRAVETPSHETVDEMRDLLVRTLVDAGEDPRVDEAGNVVASCGDGKASGTGPHVVLNTHIDTVAPHVPYERDGDVVRGRGSCDAKGPLAALVSSYLAVDPGDGRLTLAVTPDEETTNTGAAHLSVALSADGVVVGEPTGLDVCTAARGQYGGRVIITGTSAHAATPADGANAIRAVGPVLEAMERFDERRGPDAHGLLGKPTLTPTLVEGGEAPNQVPESCVITFDRRPVPPESAASFRTALEAHLTESLPARLDFRVDLYDGDAPFLTAFESDGDDLLVRSLADASGGEIRPFGAATEASYFAAHAPTVVFGPGVLSDADGAVAHSEREYVRLSAVERAADALRSALTSLYEDWPVE